MICWHIQSKLENREIISLEDVQMILQNKFSLQQLNKIEIIVMKNLDGDLYSMSYLDCLEFIYFDNCLWHPDFNVLLSLGKSVLLR